jgi:glutamine---fructose-6-phosphate transaminase (isomerizing)
MCGIVGYLGKSKALPILLEGLERLEYRGYDSAGIAVHCDKKAEPSISSQSGSDTRIKFLKSVGRVNSLKEKISKDNLISGKIGIAHTRWATHGSPLEKNAHPHCDCKRNIWVCHNGIVENYKVLKEWLIKRGHKFRSETDTEVIPHLIEEYFQGNLENALAKALKKIEGTYAIVAISEKDPNKIVAAKNSSPLVIGIGDKEYIVASDASAILSHTKKVVYLNDKEIAVMSAEGIKFLDLFQKNLSKKTQILDWDLSSAQKSGYPHFMLKEIFEQPESIANSLRGRLIYKEGIVKLGGIDSVRNKLANIKRILISSCGTAFYAGLVGEYMIEEKAGIPVEVDVASEFRYRKPIVDKHTAFLVVSQSGETADSLAALKEAKEKGVLTLGIVNAVGSTISRETDAGIYNHAGPEISVASTKAFTSQLSIFALLSLFLARQRQMSLTEGKDIINNLKKIPAKIKQILKNVSQIKRIAKKYKKFNNFFFMGRKYNYPVALEGALKLKEISYIHAEGYSAGEMKHGPIALIDKNFPSVFIVTQNSVYDKVVSNMEEVKARGGPIIAITNIGNKKLDKIADDIIYVPKTIEILEPLLNVVPLQLLAYYIGVMRGRDVDKPRNLAKSVTVE